MFHKHTGMHSNAPTIFFFTFLVFDLFNALQLSCEIQPAGFSHLTINLILIALCSFRHHACVKKRKQLAEQLNETWCHSCWMLCFDEVDLLSFQLLPIWFISPCLIYEVPVGHRSDYCYYWIQFCIVVWCCLLRPNKLYLFSCPACPPSPDTFLPMALYLRHGYKLWPEQLSSASSSPSWSLMSRDASCWGGK